MTTATASATLAAIHDRHPGLKLAKKHLLMFFAQGHHLAHFGHALFDEAITAEAGGRIVIHPASAGDAAPTSEGELNTIGYVIERYGSLSPADLRTLVWDTVPYQRAANFGASVSHDDLIAWFRREDEINDPDDERPNRAERAAADQIWRAHQAASNA